MGSVKMKLVLSSLIALSILFLSGCASSSKKVLMVGCDKTNVEVPEGILDICNEYKGK